MRTRHGSTGRGGSVTIGVDFGTSSVRALVLDVETGEEMASSVASFPLWDRGEYCDDSEAVFRQHPRESLAALEIAVIDALSRTEDKVRRAVVAMTIDTTGSTPLPVDEHARPLSFRPEFEDEPNALCHMWKDRSSYVEAEELTAALVGRGPSRKIGYLDFSGGAYSPEWYWAKILHAWKW
jgi:L-ribulokinase